MDLLVDINSYDLICLLYFFDIPTFTGIKSYTCHYLNIFIDL